MTNRHWLLAVVLLLSGLRAAAQDTNCLSTLGDSTIRGNLLIAGSCRLEGTLVIGKVTLFEGGSLTARDARILGDVEGKRGNFVDIDESLIDGNLKLEEFVGDINTVQRTDINGNAQLRNNRSRLEILNNDIGENLEVSKNTGGVLISGNAVERDLKCADNDPAPRGVGNQVGGNVTEQCINLQPEPTPSTPPPATPPPPASTPPPSTSPPPASTPPPASPPPPTATSPPASSSEPPPIATPTSSPPPATTTAPPAAPPSSASTDPTLLEGGGGAFGWSFLFLLPLVAARRRRGRVS